MKMKFNVEQSTFISLFNAKFYLYRCKVSPVWGTKLKIRPPCNCDNGVCLVGNSASKWRCVEDEKYADLDGRYIFEPIAIETLGILNTSARQLLLDLGSKISESTGEAGEASFLFQRCSVLVQRFNAILLHDSLPAYDCTDW